jgi:hypothetical protein
MSSPADPYAKTPAVAREQVGETLALEALKSERLTGCIRSHAEILAEHGYSHPDVFWNVWTSETMSVVKFIHSLSILSNDPEPESFKLTKTHLCKAMDEAIITKEPWLIQDHQKPDDLEKRRLHPRDAARWLLKEQKRANLVPEGLRAFIERTDNPDSSKGSSRAPDASEDSSHAPERDRIGRETRQSTTQREGPAHARRRMERHRALRRTASMPTT